MSTTRSNGSARSLRLSGFVSSLKQFRVSLSSMITGKRLSRHVRNLALPALVLATLIFVPILSVLPWPDAVFADSTVYVAPNAQFAGPSAGYIGQWIQFTDQSTGDITSWLWNFGDGQTSNLRNPTHSYAAYGTYTPSLTVSNPVASDSQTMNHSLLISRGVSGLTPAGSDITVTVGDVVVTFDTVTDAGYTDLLPSPGNPAGPTPPNFQTQGVFMDVSTTATYSGPITVGIPYDPSPPHPQNLKLFHWVGHWDDVTTSVDTTNHIVYGEVTSFSWFFIGGEWVWVDEGAHNAPAFPNIYIGIGAALGAGVLAYFVRRRLIRSL